MKLIWYEKSNLNLIWNCSDHIWYKIHLKLFSWETVNDPTYLNGRFYETYLLFAIMNENLLIHESVLVLFIELEGQTFVDIF